ncbi:hypothetical protein ACRE_079320 [Hapsidospora chrysogenum ATCC 11550]|uniref:Uncharacterized protein n=1 Tax=Hapsidospora chrysogenum (strain ATCC 11550 / CBS 779.69 / DSM 880 / IAM 14645 / JCM 23072 / IMI 49137) TaxID=857340 RepID=A0A086SW83_HAPC1|nr:hypothetical protein ACRE_079320 [Hapsidospora chrysogenum ATCC 11550]
MEGKVSSLTIILSTVIPVVFVAALVLLVWCCARKRSSRLFNRGITPIADEEIDSWRNDRNDEKELIPEAAPNGNNDTRGGSKEPKPQSQSRHHQQNSSVSSTHKPPSVIVYQNGGAQGQPRASGDQTPRSGPASLGHKRSLDLPQSPVLARAPNARPGLTDETVQGDVPFIPQVKRQPSRLSKSQHQRHRSAYGAIGAVGGRGDRWYGYDRHESHSRQSADNIPRRGPAQRGHERGYSATVNPPRISLDESISPGGLSPRPLLHKSEIGRAIG